MSTTFDAKFDGQVFRPTEPISLPPNTTFRITVEAIPTEPTPSEPVSFMRAARELSLEGPPAWLVDARRAILRVAELADGWDGDRSPVPQRSAVDSAVKVLGEFDTYAGLPTPHVGPIVGGGIGIEWRGGSRDLDIEFLPDGTIEYLKSERAGGALGLDDIQDGRIAPGNIKEVRELVRWLIQGC